MISTINWLVLVCGALALVYGAITARTVLAANSGTDQMRQIAAAIQEGARAYLNRQYSTIAIVGIVIAVILAFTLGMYVAIGFIIGSVLSGAAGYVGMNVSVRANVRTAEAARRGLAPALDIAFKSGAVTGMLVVGLGLLGVAIYYFVLQHLGLRAAPHHRGPRGAELRRLADLDLRAAWAAASSPRAPMSAPIWWARSRREFPRTIRATRP